MVVVVRVAFDAVSIHRIQTEWLRDTQNKDERMWFHHRERTDSRSYCTTSYTWNETPFVLVVAIRCFYATYSHTIFILRTSNICGKFGSAFHCLDVCVCVCVSAIEAIATVKTGTVSIPLTRKRSTTYKYRTHTMCYVHTSTYKLIVLHFQLTRMANTLYALAI